MKSDYNKEAVRMKGRTGAAGTGKAAVWFLWEILHPVFAGQPLSDSSLIEDDLASELVDLAGPDGVVSTFSSVPLQLLCELI